MATNYIKLTWSHSSDLGRIFYNGSGFENKMFLDVDIIRPEYVIEETGFENGDGVFVKTGEELKKRYKFELVAPEYVVDALELMRLHDTIRLMYVNRNYSTAIRNVLVDANWETSLNDCMALVTVSFEQDDQVVKTSCADNIV